MDGLDTGYMIGLFPIILSYVPLTLTMAGKKNYIHILLIRYSRSTFALVKAGVEKRKEGKKTLKTIFLYLAILVTR